MGHSRDEGHQVEIATLPHDGMILTREITRGQTGDVGYILGSITGSLQGDLLVTVIFADGEVVHERVIMGVLLGALIEEIVHSRQMRGEMPQEAP